MAGAKVDRAIRAAEAEVWGLINRGDFTEASALLAAALAAGRRSSGLDHAAGMLSFRRSEFADASTAFAGALTGDPRNPQLHYMQGRTWRALGKLRQAEACYREALRLAPGLWEAMSSLGIVLRVLGETREAVSLLSWVAQQRPQAAESHVNLANALFSHNEAQAALDAYRKALALRPSHAGAQLGVVACEAFAWLAQKRWREARDAFQMGARQYPTDPRFMAGVGVAELHLGDSVAASSAFEASLASDPEHEGAACIRIAGILTGQKLLATALTWQERALLLMPDDATLMAQHGGILISVGRFEDAARVLARALELDPDNAHAHYNRSLLTFRDGDYRRGFQEYESRFDAAMVPRPSTHSGRPWWRGEPVTNRTLWIAAEQGLGDVLQFARFLPALRRAGARRVEFAMPESLLELMKTSLPGIECHTKPSALSGSPDFECSVMSLPLALGMEEDFCPFGCPYLRASDAARSRWSGRLGRPGASALRVGLVWRGNPSHPHDQERSVALAELAGLARPEIHFFSLQKGAGCEEISTVSELALRPLGEQCQNFDDTAAVIEQLDLVITIDTSVAHLAGALGVPTWLMLCWRGEWRWGRDAGNTPWYPSMRLFRQAVPDDWPGVVAAVRAALEERLQSL